MKKSRGTIPSNPSIRPRFHPYFLEHFADEQLQLLEDELALRESACVAVGECGLDAMVEVNASLQERVFIAQ